VGENDRVSGYSFCFPNNLIEALETAVKVVWFVVDGELAVGAIDGKFPASDAVGVAPNCGTEVIFVFEPMGFFFETEKYVADLSITIRHGEGTQSRAEISDCGGDAGGVGDVESFQGFGFFLFREIVGRGLFEKGRNFL